MKQTTIKVALVAALSLGLNTVAQAQFANDDLVLGFTSSSASSDYVINLGQLLGTSAHQITLSGAQYSDSSFLSALGSAATGGNLFAGVFGGNAGSSGDVILSALSLPTKGTYNDEHNGAGAVYSVSLGLVPQAGQSVHNNISVAPGQQGAVPNSMAQFVPSPLETISAAQGSGQSLVTLEVYRSTFASGFPSGTTQNYVDQGFVSILFDADGSLGGVAWNQAATTAAVPEPSTYGLFAGAGLLLLGLRRQLFGGIA